MGQREKEKNENRRGKKKKKKRMKKRKKGKKRKRRKKEIEETETTDPQICHQNELFIVRSPLPKQNIQHETLMGVQQITFNLPGAATYCSEDISICAGSPFQSNTLVWAHFTCTII